MKLLIASDIHGSAYWCKKLFEAYAREGADRLLILGDLLYHGPRNPLPDGYAPQEVAAMLNDSQDIIMTVRGNCDADVDQMVLSFPIGADYCVFPAGDRLVYATHGHVHNVKTPLPLKKGDILLHGHTHVPAWTEFGNGNIYLNPGSTTLPKESSAHGYMTYEDGVFLWKDMDGNVYHELKV